MRISLLQQLFFPQYNGCCLCGSWAADDILCSRCFQKLDACRLSCGASLRREGALRSLAVWKHEGVVRMLIHQMKYGGNREASLLLGKEMAKLLIKRRRDTGNIDLVISVPLHSLREKKRGYNQALLLAQHMCSGTLLPLQADALVRVKQTGSQVRRTRKERMDAMQDAFAVVNASAVSGKRILLVDDVLTTGATAMACANALYSSGAAEVLVITAARAENKKEARPSL